MTPHSFKTGDHVYVGKPGPGKLHWEVIGQIDLAGGTIILRSPFTGRFRYESPSKLTPHATPEGATA